MPSRVGRVLGLIVAFVSASACTTTRVHTFRDPSLTAARIESVAILPLQDARFGPQIAVNLNKSVAQAFASRNPKVRIVGPAEAQELLGAGNLVESILSSCVTTARPDC